MVKKLSLLLLTVIALLLLSSCLDGYYDGALLEETLSQFVEEPDLPGCIREELLAQGFTDEWIDMLIADGICLVNMANQVRFGEFTDDIYNNRPIGPSGEVILQRYFGGLYFNDEGVLTVQVLAAAFDHAPSATAIEEMQELGIIVTTVVFSSQELHATLYALRDIADYARDLGVTSWGMGAENAISVWLDPYNDEQIALFMAFVREHSINPATIIIQEAVTQEARDARAASIATATRFPSDEVVLIGEVGVSRTGITFALENRTNMEFNYGAPWDLAYYANGQWTPVEHLPGAGGGYWLSWGASIQGGGIKQGCQEWSWRFGELPPGRYMFIRDGWLGEWNPNQDRIYVAFEFYITEDSPESLPPRPEIYYWPDPITLVEFSDVTPSGMTMVVQNESDYDIDHRAQILFIVPARYVISDYWWDWQEHHLPFLPVEGYWIDHLIQGEGFLPSGGQLEFTLDWTTVFGRLEPDEYVILLSLAGRAHPPHPTGFTSSDTLMVTFVVE